MSITLTTWQSLAQIYGILSCESFRILCLPFAKEDIRILFCCLLIAGCGLFPIMRIAFLLLTCLACFCCNSFAESRTWTNSAGKTIEGEYVRATDKDVSVKLTSGKIVKLPLASLSQEDQDFVKQEQETAKSEAVAEERAKLSFKWSKKLDAALKDAKEYDLPVMVLFTGTSWCPYCVKLENEVLSKSEFKRLAGGKMLAVKYECPTPGGYTPEGKKKAQQFKIKGVPHYVILNKDGKVIGDGGYHKGITPKELVEKISQAAGK